MLNLDNFELGGLNKDILQLETSEENNLCATALVEQTRQTLEIASRKLDPLVYDQVNFIAAVKNLVLGSRKAAVRIIVWEPDLIIRRGHRLLDVVSKLSSFMEIRRAGIEHKDYNSSLLIADGIGYINRQKSERFEARASFNDRRQSTLYLNEFEEMWDASLPDPNFRRIVI